MSTETLATQENTDAQLASLLPWQHRYLVALQDCTDDKEAVKRSRVSIAIVERESKVNQVFNALRQQAVEGKLRLTVSDSTRIAREALPKLMTRAVSLAQNLDPVSGEEMTVPIFDKEGDIVGHRDKVLPREQKGFIELTANIAGAMPRSSDVTVNIQNNVIERETASSAYAKMLEARAKRSAKTQ